MSKNNTNNNTCVRYSKEIHPNNLETIINDDGNNVVGTYKGRLISYVSAFRYTSLIGALEILLRLVVVFKYRYRLQQSSSYFLTIYHLFRNLGLFVNYVVLTIIWKSNIAINIIRLILKKNETCTKL